MRRNPSPGVRAQILQALEIGPQIFPALENVVDTTYAALIVEISEMRREGLIARASATGGRGCNRVYYIPKSKLKVAKKMAKVERRAG